MEINLKRVKDLTRSITSRMIITPRFKFNMSAQDALDLIAAFYCAEVRSRHNEPILDENTIRCLKEFAESITQEQPKFGLMFCGTLGNGKTTLMRAFQRCVNYLEGRGHFQFMYENGLSQYQKIQMRLVDIRDILYSARDNYKDFDAMKKFYMLGIDDVGKEKESEVKDFGNTLSPLAELFEYRYENQLFTIITTNVPPAKFKDKYGDRIADRFNEMEAKIVFTNTSYRK